MPRPALTARVGRAALTAAYGLASGANRSKYFRAKHGAPIRARDPRPVGRLPAAIAWAASWFAMKVTGLAFSGAHARVEELPAERRHLNRLVTRHHVTPRKLPLQGIDEFVVPVDISRTACAETEDTQSV